MSDSSPGADDPQRDQDVMRPRDREESGTNPGEDGKWLSVVVVLLGLWLLAETIVTAPTLLWNDLVTGVLLAGLGSYNYSRRTDERVGSFGVAVLVVVLGLWLVISPFALGPAADAVGVGTWSNVLVGVVAIGVGSYSAYETTKKPPNLTPG